MAEKDLGTEPFIAVQYGAFKFELVGAEVPGAKPGDKPVFKYTPTHPQGSWSADDDAQVAAVAQAIKDLVDRENENRAVQAELVTMRATDASTASEADAKKARETVKKNREAAAKAAK